MFGYCAKAILLLLIGTVAVTTPAQADSRHVHSFLPSARSANIDDTITAFLAVANAGDADLERCAIAQEPHGSIIPTPDIRDVIEIDANGALIDGTRFQLFNLDVGQTRRFLVGLRATPGNFNNPFLETGVVVDYTDRVRIVCNDVNSGAFVETTRNVASRFIFRAFSDRDPPDIITIMATPSEDGVIRINPLTGKGVASIAAINIGTAGDFVFRAFPVGLVSVRACRSDANGICLNPRSDEFQFHLDQNETAFFSIIIDDVLEARIPFAPDFARLTVHLNEITDDGLGAIASASVALVDEGDPVRIDRLAGQWRSGNQVNDLVMTLLPDGHYVLGAYGVFNQLASVAVSQVGQFVIEEQSEGFSITGTADISSTGEPASFTATVRSDGLMRFTTSGVLSQYRAVQIDNQLPEWVSGTFVSTSLYSQLALPLPATIPNIVISDDGTISGRFLEDLNLFERHGTTCGIEGSLHETVVLTQCNTEGTFTAQIYLVEDSSDSQSAALAYLYLENDRSSHRIYLFNVDLN